MGMGSAAIALVGWELIVTALYANPPQKPYAGRQEAQPAPEAPDPEISEADISEIGRVAPPIRLPMGHYAEWKFRDRPYPLRYQMGDMNVTVHGIMADSNWMGRKIVIETPGRAPYSLESDPDYEVGMIWAPSRIGYGRFDRAGTLFILVQTDTAGAHCCGKIELFIMHPGRTEHVVLGEWQGFELPDARDYDGDGRVDFVVSDNAFLCYFTACAEGRTPPMILNVIGGKVRDVSSRPGFRPIFARAAREFRETCLHPVDLPFHGVPISPNGACAAYVASAARAGSFRHAWAAMLRAYDRSDAHYPEDLRAFLRERSFPTG